MSVFNTLGLLHGINLGRRAINTQQNGLQTVGRNIANVNSPTYTRQRAVVGVPETRTDYQAGERTNLLILRDELTERLLLQERSRFGSLDKQGILLSQVETTFGEPSDTGLNAMIGRFFDAWESLATTPESAAAKAVVIEQSKTLTATFGSIAAQLETMQGQTITEGKALVGDINSKLQQIRDINQKILEVRGSENEVADLQGRQDAIIRTLGEALSFRVQTEAAGTRTILMNGMPLVQDQKLGQLQLEVGDKRFSVRIELDGSVFDAQVRGGTLHGLIEVENNLLPAILNDLNGLANSLIDNVNDLHPNFFGTLTAEQQTRAALFMNVLPASASNVKATAGIHAGANEIALNIGGLRANGLNELDGMSATAFYQELIGAIGARVSEASQQRDTSQLLVQQLEQRRQAASGVNLDEETTDMLLFQKGYQAAARYIEVIDELLDTIINRL